MIFNNKTFFMLAIAIGMVGACTETDSGNLTSRAVVEGYLRPGKPIELTISKEGLFGNLTTDSIEYIDGLTVKINDGETTHTLQSIGSGKYVSNKNVLVVQGKVYSLDFKYGDKDLTATTYVPSAPNGFKLSAYEIEVDRPQPGTGVPGTRPEPVAASWDNPNADYHLVVVTLIDENPEEIEQVGGGGFALRGSFRNEPNTGTSYDIREPSFEYYGMHAVILYKLNPEYATLYEESGSSSLNLKAPYSNIINGLGIFTGVHPDTLYLNVKKP
jgi:hypothetical protein